jgi:hypothetical protein
MEDLSLVKFFDTHDTMDAKTLIEKLIKVLAKQRQEYNKDILDNILKLKSIKSLNELHINCLTLRQRLLEDSHILLDKLVNLRKDYKQNKGDAYNYINNNVQIKLKSQEEKSAIVEGRLNVNETKSKMEIMDNQILFYNESIKTMDQILYGLKTRIDVEKLLGT